MFQQMNIYVKAVLKYKKMKNNMYLYHYFDKTIGAFVSLSDME